MSAILCCWVVSFQPSYRTLHLSLLSFVKFLSVHLPILSGSLLGAALLSSMSTLNHTPLLQQVFDPPFGWILCAGWATKILWDAVLKVTWQSRIIDRYLSMESNKIKYSLSFLDPVCSHSCLSVKCLEVDSRRIYSMIIVGAVVRLLLQPVAFWILIVAFLQQGQSNICPLLVIRSLSKLPWPLKGDRE